MGTHPLWVRLGVALAAVASTITIVVPSSPVLANDNILLLPGGASQVVLGPNAVLRIDGKLRYSNVCDQVGGINDFVYPASDVYIVPSNWNPVPMVTVENGQAVGPHIPDQSGGGTPNTIVQAGSFFIEQIIAITAPSGTLGPGLYSIVFDTCQDGGFLPSQDQLFQDVLLVEFPDVMPPIDSAITQLKSSAYGEWGTWKEIGRAFDRLINVESAVGKGLGCVEGGIEGCWELLKMWVDDPAIQEFISYVDLTKQAAECSTNVSACFSILGAYVGGKSSSARDVVVGGTKNLIANQAKSFFGVYADPPRSDFLESSSVRLHFPVPTLRGDEPMWDALSEMNSAIEREQLMWDALIAAMERYQGAQAAGNGAAALAQVRSARNLADTLDAAVPVTSAKVSAFEAALDATVPGLQARYASLKASLIQLQQTGFSPTADQRLRNAGIVDAGRDVLVNTLLDTALASGEPRNEFATATAKLLTQRTATAAALATVRTELDDIEAGIEGRGIAAVPSLTATASVTATVGVPAPISATTSSGATITWDLDADGEFDDGTGPTVSPSFATPGHRVVAVRAQASGFSVTTHTLVDITASNLPPIITVASPDMPGATGSVGVPLPFSVTASDPENDALTYQWRIDGEEVATGNPFVFTPTSGDRGVRNIEVTITDAQVGNVARRGWRYIISDADADGDGWAANNSADCDDTNGDVHPGRVEQLWNGIDDDCDPGTPDQPVELGSGGGEVWTWGGFNALGRPGSAAPAPIPGLGGIVQVASTYAQGVALRSDGAVLQWGYQQWIGQQTNTPTAVPGVGGQGTLTGVTKIVAGDNDQAALRTDGRVVTWGVNGPNHALGDGTIVNNRTNPGYVVDAIGNPITGVAQLFTSGFGGVAITGSGTVYQYGRSYCDGASFGTNTETYAREITNWPAHIVEFAAPAHNLHGLLLRQADGSVWVCGERNNQYDPEKVLTFGPDNPAISIAASVYSWWVVTQDGKLWVRTTTPATAAALSVDSGVWSPVALPDNAKAVEVVAYNTTYQVRLTDGRLLTFGVNTFENLGRPGPDSWAMIPVGVDGFVADNSGWTWNGMAVVAPGQVVRDSGWAPPQTEISVSAVGGSGPEGGEASVSIALSAPAPIDLRVDWTFDGAAGSTTVAMGSTAVPLTLTLPVRDGVWGLDRQRTLAIVTVSGGAAIANERAEVLVLDADPKPVPTIEDLTVAEGDGVLTDVAVVVTMSGPAAVPLLVDVVSTDATAEAGTDYRRFDAQVLVLEGATSAIAHVLLLANGRPQPNRAFELTATLDNARDAADITIRDDDPITLMATGASVIAGQTATARLAPLSLPDGETVVVSWATGDGTAIAGADFTSGSGELVIGPAGVSVDVVTTAAASPLAAALTTSETGVFFVRMSSATSSAGRAVLLGPDAAILVAGVIAAPPPTTPTATTPPTPTVTATPPAAATPTTTPAILPAAPATPPAPPPTPVLTGGLPETGRDLGDLIRLAGAALGLGVLIVFGTRRGARTETDNPGGLRP